MLASFFFVGIKCHVTKVAEEHSCCDQSVSSDLGFGDKPDSILCAYMTGGLPVISICPVPFGT